MLPKPSWQERLRLGWDSLHWCWKIAFLLLLLLPASFYGFHWWRARDLAAKALVNLDSGNFRMAWLQLLSARQMRPRDTEVLRAGAIFEGKLGRKESLELWEELALKTSLSNDDRVARAVSAMLLGTAGQFEEAVTDLSRAVDPIKAWALRIGRHSVRGDLGGAIEEARQAVSATADPGLRLGLAKLLLRRHAGPVDAGSPDAARIAAFQEMAAIVDSLQGTPEAAAALAFGLDNLKVPPEVAARWTQLALARPSPNNPALLPAAEAAVQSGWMTPEQLAAQLGPLYKAAPLDRRSAFALWLAAHDLTREALQFVSAKESSYDAVPFVARAEALARQGEWEKVAESADAATGPPESVRLLTRARAETALGGAAHAQKSIRFGLQAAAREARLPAAVGMADKLSGGPQIANEELALLCANPLAADIAFRILLPRLLTTAGTESVIPAYESARLAAPKSRSVQDFGRYLSHFRGAIIDPALTAAAVEEEPANVSMRMTHALLLLRLDRPAEASAVFDDITVFFKNLPPPYQAVVASITGANGQHEMAVAMRAQIDSGKLSAGEKDLLFRHMKAR